MTKIHKLLAFTCLLLCSGALATSTRAQTTYYIDPVGGANSNNGLSTGSPWKSHPFMSAAAGCTGNGSLPAYSHHAGDKFVWKGGTTVPAACLPMNVTVSGGTGNPDYYGVCLSTDSYSPCSGGTSWPSAGWTRPLWDAAYANKAYMFNANGQTNWTLDNIEIAHQGITLQSTFSTNGCGIFGVNGTTNNVGQTGTLVVNVYLHDWAVIADMNNMLAPTCVGGIGGVRNVFYTEISDANGYGYNGTTQVFEPIGGGVAYGGEAKFDKIHDGWNGCTTFISGGCHDSEFYGIEQNGLAALVNKPSGQHTQVIEDNETCGGSGGARGNSMPVYNNYIHDSDAGVYIFVRYFSPIYNNVMFNNAPDNAGPNNDIRLCVPVGQAASDVGYVVNNTFDLTGSVKNSGTVIAVTDGGAGGTLQTTALGTMYIQNNITISSAGAGSIGSIGAGTQHYSNNYSMAGSEATSFGFTIANKYAPASSDGNVVGQGVNLASFCSGSLAALCSDAEGTAWYGGTTQQRPTGTTAWTLGAYVWPVGGGGGGRTPPTVTITAPSNGATVSGMVNFTQTCSTTGAGISGIGASVDGATFGSAGTTSPDVRNWDTTQMSNQAHTLGANCTDTNNLTTAATPVVVTVSNALGTCFISDFTWQNYQAIPAQSGSFTIQFTATPMASANDLVVGLSTSPATTFADMAVIVRFNQSGNIDVFNGGLGTYSALASVPYAAGTTYAFTVSVNVATHTYSVQLTSPTVTTLATNYAFRGTQSGIASLSYINAHSDLDSLHNVEVCTVSFGAGTLQVTPGELGFGNVADGVAATNGIVATANGGSITFTSVGLSGDPAFTITSNTCTGTVGMSANCTVTLRFLAAGVGLRTAVLTFTDSASGSPQSIAINAVAVPLPGVVVPITTMVF
ncbi:MAG TPA: Ig-like domain-containing protein [Candidatus Acidoferrales bacterium]|nr:Ig-like domain-containing protein [Candidatus Acidoferrales bacterium]